MISAEYSILSANIWLAGTAQLFHIVHCTV